MENKFKPGINTPVPMSQSQVSWYKTRTMKMSLVALGIVGVILIVLFSQQIGDLLRLIGSKAALETGGIVLDGTTTQPNYFLANSYSADVWDPATSTWVPNQNAVTIDNQNRLILNTQ